MAKVAGYGGSVTFASGYATHAREWSVDRSAEALDATDFDSGQDKEVLAGLRGATGSYTCLLDDTTVTVAPGVSGAATFEISGSRTITGTILITGVRYGVSVEGLATVSFEFTFNGAVTIN